MIIDKELEFSNAQAVTVTAHSTNIIDTGVAGEAIGRELWFRCKVATLFAGTGAKLVVTLTTDSVVAFSSAKTLYTSSLILVATLVKGYQIARFKLPLDAERYLRVTYTVSIADFTAGAFDCELLPAIQTNDL